MKHFKSTMCTAVTWEWPTFEPAVQRRHRHPFWNTLDQKETYGNIYSVDVTTGELLGWRMMMKDE